MIPGAGQRYAGNLLNVLNALLLNVSLFSWVGITIIHGYYIDAAFIFLYIAYRYYSGNLYNAGKMAIEYNTTKDRRIAVQIVSVLLESK